MPHLAYQSDPARPPSDPDADARASINAWVRELQLANVRSAIALDAESAIWLIDKADAVLCINMIHIAPWKATLGAIADAGRVLRPDAILYFYGPFRREGHHTAPSNASFDRDLHCRNPAWGVRNLETVADVAKACGFGPPMVLEMPANNLSIIFRREP